MEKADVMIKFCSMEGIDRSTAENLWEAGFRSIDSLASSAPEQMDEECQISLFECKRIVAVARKKIEEKKSLHDEIDDLFEETGPTFPSDAAAFDEERKAAVSPQPADNPSAENPGSDEERKVAGSPQPADNPSAENPRVVMFRRRLARMIVKELF